MGIARGSLWRQGRHRRLPSHQHAAHGAPQRPDEQRTVEWQSTTKAARQTLQRMSPPVADASFHGPSARVANVPAARVPRGL